jgi:PAS domain S-box-containing protein
MQKPNRPIEYINKCFTELTGYTKDDVTDDQMVGRNPAFLQGDERQKEATEYLRTAFKMHKSISIEVINYKMNGDKFINLLTLLPVIDKKHVLRYYIGIAFDLTAAQKDQCVFHKLLYTQAIIKLLPSGKNL